MKIIMNQYATRNEIHSVESKLSRLGLKTYVVISEGKVVIGAVGDRINDNLQLMLSNADGVESIVSIVKPFEFASRELKSESTIVNVGGVEVGGNNIVVMAGPCAIESEQRAVETALQVKKAGARILRGGAFKPRTSPYTFQGLEEDGLKILSYVRAVSGLKVVTEVVDTRDVELVASYADILQIGARNMQNFRLLQEVGMSNKPVLLKRGFAASVQEWLMAAEYIIASGNPNVILCERGIRTFENTTRYTLDLSAIPVVKELSHLPIIIDPSHASGTWKYINPLSKGAIAIGADGLIIEVHSDPDNALCDGPQSLRPSKFAKMMEEIRTIAVAVGRTLS